MANSYIDYTTSGTGTNGLGQRVFTVPTLYRHIDDIRAKGLSGSTWSDLSISARGTTTVTLSAVPTGKSKVRIYRQTPADPLVDFTKGATLTAADLDSAYNQGLLLSQEVAEQADPSGGSGISGITSSQLASNLSLGGTTTTNTINCNGTLNLLGNSAVQGERDGNTMYDTLALYANDGIELRTGSNASSQTSIKVEQVGSGTSAKVTAPLTTNANITSAGNKSLITKEYADANYNNYAPPAGSILETFSLVCEGTSATVSSGTYTSENVTGFQTLTTGYADVSGSSITYTPPSDATSVVYEFDYSLASGDQRPLINFDLYFDGIEIQKARHTQIPYYDARHSFRWVFRIGGSPDMSIGNLASWTTAKTIKLRCREHTTSFDGVLHKQYHRNGAQQNNLSLPIISITAIK